MAKAAKSITPPEKVNDETLRAHVGYHMKRAFNTVQTDVNRVLAPFGLRMVTFCDTFFRLRMTRFSGCGW